MALQGYTDKTRTVFAMTGADVRAVLQNVVTNDVDAVAPGVAVYSALLTPQGKYLFDFFLLDGVGFGWPTGTILVDVASERAAALAQRFKMYCLRRDAAIEPETGMFVALVWGEGATPEGAIPDPRSTAIGWRLYSPNAAVPAGITSAALAEYDALRVAHLIPQSGVELQPDDTYILEAGFERLSGVDFRKGCYVGQEVTARMKHKTELRKGLVQVQIEGSAQPGTLIQANGKAAGTLFTTVDGQGLAHLRLDRAGPDMLAGTALVSYAAES